MLLLPSHQGSLWRDRAFVLYWLARAVSIAGSTLTVVVLPILVYRLTGSALQTSALAALAVAPYLFFGLVAGVLADRGDRKRLMIACDLANALLLTSIPLADAVGTLTLPHLYAVALLSATLFVWFDAANFGALPAVVGRDRLVAANAAVWSTATLVEVAAPAVGGLLAATLGPATTLALDAASYLCSALALALIPRSFNAPRPGDPSSLSAPYRIRDDIRDGLRFLWRHPLVRTLTLTGFGVSVTGGAVTALLVVYGVEALGLPDDSPRLGLLFSAGAAGALLAGLLLPRLSRRFHPGRLALIGMTGALAALLALAAAPTFLAGLVLYFLWFACHTLVVLNGITTRQRVTPDGLQSRVNTTARMIAWGGTPFGAAGGGLLADASSVRLTYVLMASGLAFALIAGWFSPLRHPTPLR